jgi:uncharacterized membrane protein
VYGKTVDDLNGFIDCSNKNMTSYTNIAADNHVFIVAVGTSDKAYFEFSYKVVQTTFWKQFFIMSVAAAIVLSCLIACFIGFVLQKTTSVKISRAAAKLKDSAIVMSIEMNKAETAHLQYTKIKGDETKVKNQAEAKEWKENMAKKKETADAIKAGKPVPQNDALDRSSTRLLQE